MLLQAMLFGSKEHIVQMPVIQLTNEFLCCVMNVNRMTDRLQKLNVKYIQLLYY